VKVHALTIAAGLISLGMGINPANATVGGKAWAACIWQEAPRSASNWLKMDEPTWKDNLETPRELLGIRLINLCNKSGNGKSKKSGSPKWKKIRRQLERTRPSVIGELDSTKYVVEVCESFAVQDQSKTLYLAEIYRRSGVERTPFRKYPFASASSTALELEDRLGRKTTLSGPWQSPGSDRIRLPRDIISKPKAGFQVETSCRVIASDGQLLIDPTEAPSDSSQIAETPDA